MLRRPINPHAWFFILAFILLGIASLIWAKHVRENYQAPEAKVENIVPDPFAPNGADTSK